MIRIQKLHIHEFRGIRDLTLDVNDQNFAACGPNGTGKSGIVDAIEFALTGNISRLSGSGTGGLSVKIHGPHVDSRNKPENSFVKLDVIIPSLANKRASIERTVRSATAPTITPSDSDVITAFGEVLRHPEFVLSRRELIRYVLSEPGQRAKEVQALLRLEDIERLRTVLQKISNSCGRELPGLERAEKDAIAHLLTALGAAQLSKNSMLQAVNPMRELLGVPALTDLGPTTSVKDGLATAAKAAPARVPKVQASGDLAKLKEAIAKLESSEIQDACRTAAYAATELLTDAALLEGVTRETLLRSALEVYNGESCPVCDTLFGTEAFHELVTNKLQQLEEVTRRRNALERQISPILDAIHTTGSSLAAVIAHAALFDPPVNSDELKTFKTALAGRYGQLQKLLPLDETIAVLNANYRSPDLAALLGDLEAAIAAIPEVSKQDLARDFLIVAQERLEQYRGAAQKHLIGKRRAERAAKVFHLFGDVTTKALEEIYKDVQEAFSEFYRVVNHQDESSFTARLMPSIGKLGFDVDFYGRGHFPPGAYHSEGHQDGMGLCLYLALMKHLLGTNFSFAVLDDVLMSVDSGHRREVCALLQRHFPTTQFIFTTHDEVWLKHMKSEGLIKGRSFVHFRTWDVDFGPTEWDNRDIWTEASDQLARNDVRAAASLLRHYLEHFAKEACDRLRASVEYRGDAQFSLGELLPNATKELGDLFRRAKAAANSWNQRAIVDQISARDAAFTQAKARTCYEQWQVNAAVHFNSWADLQRADFEPVVSAFKGFTDSFVCSSCSEMFYVVPERGEKKESLRCGCGATNLNLLLKI